MTDEEYRIEAAMCLWEYVLENKQIKNPRRVSPFGLVMQEIIERNGTVAARSLINNSRLLDACVEGYEALSQEFGEDARESILAVYDWEYVPFFADHCLNVLGLKSNWKEELFAAFRAEMEKQRTVPQNSLQ